eukprot:jgi/Tetstr1/456305/TSEL_043061.t1
MKPSFMSSKAAARAVFEYLTGGKLPFDGSDEAASLASYALFADDLYVIFDLRKLNGEAGSTEFDVFWTKLAAQLKEHKRVDDRRHARRPDDPPTRPTAGQRPQRPAPTEKKQAPQEIITIATMEINIPEEQQKAAVGAALDAPRGGKTQLPKIRTAINAEQIAGTRFPPAACPRLADGQRPPRREEQAPQETTTTANMNINRLEGRHEAEVGATIDAPRSGRAKPPKTPSTIAAKKFTYTRLPPAVRRRLRVSSGQSRQPPIDLPLDTDCATQVAMLFGNLATRKRVSRAGLATNTGSDAKLVAASITHLYGREKIATDHHPAPPTADQSAMHHGQLPQELQPPPTTQLQVAHAPAAAAPRATEMDSDERLATGSRAAGDKRRSSPAPRAGSTGRSQAPTVTREASEATNPSSIPPHPAHQPRRPAWPSSRQGLIASAARRPGRPPCSRRWIVCGCSAGKAPNPKPKACPRLSAPPLKNYGRF